MKPKFDNFADECTMNDAYKINKNTFNKYLFRAKNIHKNILNIVSKYDDKKFGIKKYQFIGIQHVLGIILYKYQPKYSSELARSLFLLNKNEDDVINYHSNNFYWFGRYVNYPLLCKISSQTTVCWFD